MLRWVRRSTRFRLTCITFSVCLMFWDVLNRLNRRVLKHAWCGSSAVILYHCFCCLSYCDCWVCETWRNFCLNKLQFIMRMLIVLMLYDSYCTVHNRVCTCMCMCVRTHTHTNIQSNVKFKCAVDGIISVWKPKSAFQNSKTHEWSKNHEEN